MLIDRPGKVLLKFVPDDNSKTHEEVVFSFKVIKVPVNQMKK
jgi:hypothetical protein